MMLKLVINQAIDAMGRYGELFIASLERHSPR